MRWMISSMLAIGLTSGLGLNLTSQEPAHLQQIFTDLQSSATSDNAAAQLRKEAESDTETRRYVAAHLPSLIKDSGPGSVWLNEVRLAGDLKISEAVPVLIDQVMRANTQGGFVTLTRALNLDNDPPGKALAQIGEPAIVVVGHLLESSDRSVRFRACYILAKIGSANAKGMLRNHLDKENDRGIRHFTQNVLDAASQGSEQR
ncbi:HEAT repeat domain-containing protein [Acidicapsa ligni]|uniref:HEAT repeat domain-containing protein n=1 Tax=Acidicapsa ligni TaxID=542300 RepID=UPI0021DFEF01|nr:HEAT repeat domain-containing protein [Acidicapsa ligni]